MNKITVYAEKPDIAIKIAVALSDFTIDGKKVNIDNVEENKRAIDRKYSSQGYIPIKYNGDEMYITWGKGHMCELKQAYDYNPEYRYWSNLPVPFIPNKYEIKIKNYYNFKTKKTENRPDPWAIKQLGIIKGLFEKSDYIINATDYDREGEVIFGYVYQIIGVKKPYKRVKLDSLTESGIKKSFENLESSDSVINLEYAGRGRAIADWVVGANLTAVMSLKYGTKTNPLYSIGRVQTPTLNLIVEREKEIRDFVSEPFWTLRGEFEHENGNFEANHIGKRFFKKEDAVAVFETVKGKDGEVVKYEKKNSNRLVPLLYNLTSLSMDVNSKYGYTASDTLNIVQGLYDRGLVTYPRTSSQHLTDDMKETVDDVLDMLSSMEEYRDLISPVEKTKRNYTKRHFDSKKVDSHYAIIPTNQKPGSLSDRDRKVYDLIAKSLIQIIYKPAVYENTKVEVDVNGEIFEASGKVLIDPQWLIVNGTGNDSDMPLLSAGDKVKVLDINLNEGKTTPPKRYTDKSLLSAMVSAGRKLDDEELIEIMVESGDGGIGRESTRSNIIESVVARYCKRDGKYIVPTENGMALIDLIPFEDIKSAQMTAEWELFLDKVAKGEKSIQEFVSGIEGKTTEWSRALNELEGVGARGMNKTDKMCPKCQKGYLLNSEWGVSCELNTKDDKECDFFIPRNFCGKDIKESDIELILSGGTTDWYEGLVSKKGNKFSARFKLDESGGFSLSFDSDYKCPDCGSSMGKNSFAYICNNKSCSAVIPHTLSGKKLTDNQVKQLFEDGKTDMIKGFVSKKGNKFEAMIVRKDKGFEFKFDNFEEYETDINCPTCRGKLLAKKFKFECQDKTCGYSLQRLVAGRELTDQEGKTLISEGIVGPLDGFVSKKGNEFSASLKLSEKGGGYVDFVFDNSPKEAGVNCPNCGDPLYDAKYNLVCKNQECQTKIPQIIAGKKLTDKQIKSLIEDGETNLIKGFKSKAGNSFDAKLVLNGNSVNFEFPN